MDRQTALDLATTIATDIATRLTQARKEPWTVIRNTEQTRLAVVATEVTPCNDEDVEYWDFVLVESHTRPGTWTVLQYDETTLVAVHTAPGVSFDA